MTSPTLAKARPVAYGIEEELSSQDDHSAPDDPLSPFSDHADLPPSTDEHGVTFPPAPFSSSLPKSNSVQSSRTVRPTARGDPSPMPVSGSTPALTSAQHSPSTHSLSSWANGVASSSTRATAGATKRALHAGGGLAGKVISKPAEMFGHGRSMSNGLLGKGKEKDKAVRTAKDRLAPLESGPPRSSSFLPSGPSTAPSGSSSFPRSSLYPSSALGPASSSSSSTPPSATLAGNSNRSSQIVVQSGLVLRHTPVGPSSGPFRSSAAVADDLSKGWKPFKIVLQGSKLHFYKPPSDKKVEIEARFPTRVVQSLVSPLPSLSSAFVPRI